MSTTLPKWASLLKQRNCAVSNENDDNNYGQLLSVETKKLFDKQPDNKQSDGVPNFFNKKKEYDLAQNHNKNNEALIAITEMARELFLDNHEERLLSEHDLDCLFGNMLSILNEYNKESDKDGVNTNCFLNYEIFRELKQSLPPRAHKFFTASIFRKFPLNGSGKLRGISFHQFVSLSLNLLHQYITLCRYDINYNEMDNYLTESDLEIFIGDQIEMIPSLQRVDEAFHPYYIYHAVRKFMFVLNADNTNKK
eukprot:318348_1